MSQSRVALHDAEMAEIFQSSYENSIPCMDTDLFDKLVASPHIDPCSDKAIWRAVHLPDKSFLGKMIPHLTAAKLLKHFVLKDGVCNAVNAPVEKQVEKQILDSIAKPAKPAPLPTLAAVARVERQRRNDFSLFGKQNKSLLSRTTEGRSDDRKVVSEVQTEVKSTENTRPEKSNKRKFPEKARPRVSTKKPFYQYEDDSFDDETSSDDESLTETPLASPTKKSKTVIDAEEETSSESESETEEGKI